MGWDQPLRSMATRRLLGNHPGLGGTVLDADTDKADLMVAQVLTASRSSPGMRTQAKPRPLVVDLDQTLVRTDTLVETLAQGLFRQPLAILRALATLPSGRARFKRAAQAAGIIDCGALPFEPAVLAMIGERRAAGGETHLVTAADQRIAEGVAAHLGIFDSAEGSDGELNLKGATKADRLRRRFPDGFDYVGDSNADLPVWRDAGSAVVIGASPSLLRQIQKLGLTAHTLPRPRASLRTWVRTLRLHQWSKNLLVMVPLLLSREFTNLSLLGDALAAFLLFGVIASATYLINDISDVSADRRHPTKRFRGIASGLIPVATALPLAVAMLVAALLLATFLHLQFAACAAAYVALTLGYSFRLKREPLVDVMVIAGLFGLRVTAGMVVIGRPVSPWLVTFTLSLFLSLALAKRNAELVQANAAGRIVSGRGYQPGDQPLTLTLGMAAGTVSVLVMLLYFWNEAMPTGLYAATGPLYLIPIVLCCWIQRIWLLAHRGTLHDDPVIFALRDRVSWAMAGCILALWATASLA